MNDTWTVYYVDPADDVREWVESFSDPKDAYRHKHELEAEIEADPDSDMRVIVVEE